MELLSLMRTFKFSLTERDRRYRAVREEMAKVNLDVLVLPANHARWEQMMADSRYLTTIGGFGTEALTVFPREGDVTSYVFNRSQWWKSAQNWVTDVRDGRNAWSENVIERLNELGLRRGRVGLSGLGPLLRAPDGLFPYQTVKRIADAAAGLEMVDATALMQAVRTIKSDEEVSCLQQSMTIVERMIDVMRANAAPGRTERQIYARMVETLVSSGGELPSLLILGAGPELSHGSFVPTDRVIQTGDTILNEIEARCAGYSGQGLYPISVGEPSTEYRDLASVAETCFYRLCDIMADGVPLGALLDRFQATIEIESRGRFEPQFPLMNARGLGDDVPSVLSAESSNQLRDVVLRNGMTFVLKPAVRSSRSRRSARIGDTILVTPRGGERLGTRSLTLAVV